MKTKPQLNWKPWDAVKTMPRQKFITLNAYIRIEEISEIPP